MAELGYQDSIASLVRGIMVDLRELVREELALARVEIKEQAAKARLASASLGAGVAALVFGAAFLLVAMAVGIADLLNWPVGAGFLVMALLLSVTGAALLGVGRKRLRSFKPVPEETVRTLKENSEWITKRLSSAKR